MKADVEMALPPKKEYVLYTPLSERQRALYDVVVRGDTLWSIAASYLAPGAPAEDVAASLPGWLEANPLLRLDPDTIEVGQQLTLPASFVSTTSAFGAHR